MKQFVHYLMLIGRLTYRAEEAGAFLGGGRRTRLEQRYRGSQSSWLPSVLQVRYSYEIPAQANTTFKIIVHSSCPNYSRAGGLPCACLKIRLQSWAMCSFAFKFKIFNSLTTTLCPSVFAVNIFSCLFCCSIKKYMLHVKVDKTNLTLWVDYHIYV